MHCENQVPASVQKRLKVYLDTSVISYLHQEDSPERMRDTQALWQMFKEGRCNVVLSELTIKEVEKCYEPKKSFMLKSLSEIQHEMLPSYEESARLALKIIEMGILTAKSMDDCFHIASALLSDCDCIASWNFKHMVNVRTICGMQKIAQIEGYNPIAILSPSILLKNLEEGES